MQGKSHIIITSENGWYDLDIREYENGLLIQVWASVVAILSKICPQKNIWDLIWPGDNEPMNKL